MTTKTKKTPAKRGRPKKDFSMIKTTSTVESSKKRPRGRPKKEIRVEESINSKIIDHGKEINKLSQKNKNIHLDIENSSFVSRKIDKKPEQKTDTFALALLIFSMLLFIFSLYKTFYINKNIEIKNYNKYYEQIKGNDNLGTNENSPIDNKIDEIKNEENNNDENLEQIEILATEIELNNKLDNKNIIQNFYDKINQKEFTELSNLVDVHLKSSNVFRTYYNKNRLEKYIGNLINSKVYINNIHEILDETTKENTAKYGYTIKYKINGNNEIFKEDREMILVNRGDQKLIGSIRCITTGCSKMPFFSPQRYGIK